jgi:CTP synthase
MHLTLVPYIPTSGEQKTKPTQHSVRELLEIGIQPDVLLCRADRPLPSGVKKKIALYCNLEEEAVIAAMDVESIYEVPLSLHDEGLASVIDKKLGFEARDLDLSVWKDIVQKVKAPKHEVTISIVGKYVGLKDSYKSLTEALAHGGIANDARVNLDWVDSEEIEASGAERYLAETDGILVPGGFGHRGIEGKVQAIRYAREKKIPFFGICLGMQCAVIEFARNMCALEAANSSEFDLNTSSPVIYLMEKWYDHRHGKVEERDEKAEKGGTMRLGAYPCVVKKETFAYAAYETDEISERHRHRYEFNNAFKGVLSQHGMRVSGASPDAELVEIVEVEDHPWFLGCQFHPEFKSRPTEPHPLFREFIAASLREKRELFSVEDSERQSAP